MPELPEVETIRRQLEKELKGALINKVEVRFGEKISPAPPTFIKKVTDKKIISVERRAKLIIIHLSGGLNILVHLMMTGRLLLRRNDDEVPKHTHVIFHLNKNRQLRWEDWRRFGFLKLMTDAKVLKYLEVQGYGPEPLEKSFTWQKMALCLRGSPRKKIKPLLLEQSCIAGIGNIYAAEAVWYAQLHPETRIQYIDDAHMKQLCKGLIKILKSAIPARGSSADSYVDIYGHQGTFVPKLNVYGRAGKPCRRCDATLTNLVLGGRATVFCPRCQKK
ncbi:MAG: bifunctional DNA-formamidopyrimidine glycosylase/DNA-(apurinic or apyrimidinic site) lyase [Patescibacteria group bacterium]